MALTFASDGYNPSLDITCPKYYISDIINLHLLFFYHIPAFSSRINTSSNVARCSALELPVTRISSIYTVTLCKP